MSSSKRWILDRLKEKSTWRGLAFLAGALGIGIAPSLVLDIGALVTGFLGAIDVVSKE